MLPPDLQGAVAQPSPADDGAQAAAGSDPAAIVDVAVEQGIASPDRPDEITPPEKAALVRAWWDRTAETADFQSAVEQKGRDQVTLDGGRGEEVDDDAEVTINHVYRNAIQTVAQTVPEMSDVKWGPRKEVEPLPGMPIPPEVTARKRQQQGLASVVTTLWGRFAEMGNLQEKIEAWVQDSVHFPVAVFKVWFQRDLAGDPIGEERLPDEQDLLARSRVLIELYDRGEIHKGDARYEDMRNCLKAIGKTEADVKRGIVVEMVPLEQYRCDPSVTGPEHHDTAAWERHDVLMTRDEIMGKWAHISPDDLQRGITYAVDETGRAIRQKRVDKTSNSRETSAVRSLPDTRPQPDDWMLCAEIYDYQSNTRLVLVEGLEYPAVEEPILQGPSGMSPFVVLVENRRSGSFYGYSDTELQAKGQRQLNRMRSQEEDSKRQARPRWLADANNFPFPDDLKKAEAAEPGTITPVRTAGKDWKDGLFPLVGNHEHNPAEFDGEKTINEMHRMAMLPDDTLRSANFSSEVQSATMTASALFRYRQARIKRALKRLCNKGAQLILFNVNQETAVRLAGPMAAYFYPARPMDRKEIYDGLTINVEVSMDQQLDYAKRADSLVKFMEVMQKGGIQFDRESSAKLLGKFMGVDEASELIKSDPNDLVSRLMQALQENPTALAPEAVMALVQIGQQAQQQAVQIMAQQQQAAQQQPQAAGGMPPGQPSAPQPGM